MNLTTADYFDVNGTRYPLSISEKGCISIPDQFETLRVRSRIAGNTVSRTLAMQDLSNSNISKISLQDIPTLSVLNSCQPSESKVYSLANIPYRVVAEGESRNIQLTLFAKSRFNQELFEIGVKKFGVRIEGFFGSADFGDLDPGIYDLTYFVEDMNLGLNAGPKEVLASEKCTIEKLPSLKMVKRTFKNPNVDVGEVLFSKVPGLTINSCKTKLTNLKDIGGKCELSSSCINLSDFVKGTELRTVEPGEFRYYYYLTDEHGQNSDLVCEDLLVGQSPHHFQ